jgi:hypothetical protein
MEYPWDDIEVDYPPHILDQIERFERSYLERERGKIYIFFSFLSFVLIPQIRWELYMYISILF